MCQTEKIKELKYLIKDIQFTDEEIIKYVKNSTFYNEITNDMKVYLVRKYLEELEIEKEEKFKNDFLERLNQIKVNNI